MPRRSAPQILKYDLEWNELISPVSIEATMIRKGGRWKKDHGGYLGEGLFFHFKEFISLVWPEYKWHKWSELSLKAYLDNRIIGVLGPASSGKTCNAAIQVLTDFYVWSDCTTVLASSTTLEMLDMRVWGEIKNLHKKAKALHGAIIPGNLIESRRRIVTDGRWDSEDGRDFRNGLCFPGETMIDTPSGSIRIDQIQVGDEIINACGIGYVKATQSTISKDLIRVHLEDQRTIDCTIEHPFLTQRGWVKGIDLETSDMVFSSHEAMQMLQDPNSCQYDLLLSEMSGIENLPDLSQTNRNWLSKPKILQCDVSRFQTSNDLHSMRQSVSAVESEAQLERQNKGSILRPSLCGSMGGPAQGMSKTNYDKVRSLRNETQVRSSYSPLLFQSLPGPSDNQTMHRMRQSFCVDSNLASQTTNAFLLKALPIQILRTEKFKKRKSLNPGGTISLEFVPSINCALSCRYWNYNISKAKTLVPIGHCFSGNQTRRGNRWRSAQNSRAHTPRQIAHAAIAGTRVDRIEILKPEGDARFDQSKGGYRVYNFSVTNHPSYSVNGIIVHNCAVPLKLGGNYQGLGALIGVKNKRVRLIADELSLCPPVFIDAIANLNKNPDFKCLGMGNPKDTTDALGRLCEPAAHLGGWDGGIDQEPKTKTWAIRFSHGICLQLVGSDSPNLDGNLGIPLIDQKSIDVDVAFYGKESLQFTMMNEGRMPRGQGLRRVITRQMCLKFGAMEEPVWKNDQRIRIGFLDAAYGAIGGDRCVFGEMQLGFDPNGKQILALIDSLVVPIKADSPDIPEDQIANFVKSQCDLRNIPPQNFGFDSTGRGSLMGAFGRIWSPNVVGIEFGGKPSERQVTWISKDAKVTCRDYYFNFVSELWYSVALTIQSGQYRGLTEDIMTEGCMREWGFVSGNKIQVEPKEKMKLKTGRSPDLFDAMVCGVEMARRHGFNITMTMAKDAAKKDERWKNFYRDRMEKLEKNHRLTYS